MGMDLLLVLPSTVKLYLALVAPSLVLQVSLGTELLGLEIPLDPMIQILLCFGGIFTVASGELGHEAFRTGAAPGPCHSLPNAPWLWW
jgi:hypothetical protein